MNQEERGKRAFELDQRIKQNENNRRISFAENAELLYEMFKEGYYKEVLGTDDGEWAGYLSDLEVFYTRNQVDNLLRVYKKLSLDLNIPKEAWVEVPLQRLADSLLLFNSENYMDWFTKALTLTTEDWNIELRTAKGKTLPDDGHRHKYVPYEACSQCGKRHRLTFTPDGKVEMLHPGDATRFVSKRHEI